MSTFSNRINTVYFIISIFCSSVYGGDQVVYALLDRGEGFLACENENNSNSFSLAHMNEFSVALHVCLFGENNKQVVFMTHDRFEDEQRHKAIIFDLSIKAVAMFGGESIKKATIFGVFVHDDNNDQKEYSEDILDRKMQLVYRLCHQPVKTFNISERDVQIGMYQQADLDAMGANDEKPFEYVLQKISK